MKINTVISLSILVFFSLACNFLNRTEENNENKQAATPTTSETPAPKTDPGENTKTNLNETNYLGLANGAFLVKKPARRNAFDYSPINLIFNGMIWRSPSEELNNQIFVIETSGETTLKNIEFDTSHPFYTPDENAKDILLEASNESAESGFQTVLETSLAKESENLQKFPVKAEIPARWFRLTIKNNHGSTEATALKAIKGYGTQKTSDVPQNLTGTYKKIDDETGKVSDVEERDDLLIKQDGTLLLGCWRSSGIFSGGLEGTAAKINWTQPDLGKNSGLMIFAQNKRLVFWRLKADSFWALEEFERVNPDPGECSEIPGFKGTDSAKSEIAENLEKTGRAVIYGINFDFNSDKLRDESKIVLNKIVTVLKENPEWKMAIEGHTDNIGGESFNQNLSEKRAKSVADFLTNAGIDANRLSSSGLGLSKPLASNETEIGRAQNRRVELVKQ